MHRRGEGTQTRKMISIPSKLFLLCIERQWTDVLQFLHDYPHEAGQLLNTGKKGAAKVSTLQVVLSHAKCQGSVPLDVIDALLEVAPNLANSSHLYTGNVPLHAVFYNAFFNANMRKEIAERLLVISPESATTKNKDGRTPLHTNCSQHCNYEPILTLLKSAPETASWVDSNGDLPIHLACRSQKSPNKSIIVLFKAFPESIGLKNAHGLRPIDIAKVCPMNQRKRQARIKLLANLELDLKRKRSMLMETHSISEHDLTSTSGESAYSESFSDNTTNGNPFHLKCFEPKVTQGKRKVDKSSPPLQFRRHNEDEGAHILMSINCNEPKILQRKFRKIERTNSSLQVGCFNDDEGEKCALILMNMHHAYKL